jgi:(2Fe-2S) ferredoxin
MQRADDVPYSCHVFVCVNDRHGEARSCADGGSLELKTQLKRLVAERGIRSRIRVSHCGCMGLCADGPNVVAYPQRVWFQRVRPEDAPAIVDELIAACDRSQDPG